MNLKSRMLLCLLLLLFGIAAGAHPMPSTGFLLDMREAGIDADLLLPLPELQLALGDSRDVTSHPETLVARDSAWLAGYVLAHLRPATGDGKPWVVSIGRMRVDSAAQDGTGSFRQLQISLSMSPPPSASARSLVLYYDAIIHQVVTHKALVAIRQDWDAGAVGDGSGGGTELGVISFNPADNTVPPLRIRFDAGSRWRGFRRMVSLGVTHISEGTDHLLFLLVLLLPAPLLARAGRWAEAGGPRYSTLRLLKIATAFTLGHSATLLAGALGWLRLPQQPVEVLIAVSILVTAVHAIRPLFPGREAWVAAGFGLVHGLAFASVLYGLQLSGGRMALSILGFNLGIEVMQLFVIILFVPWLVFLSRSKWYSVLRIGGAVVAGIASTAWIGERVSGRPSRIGSMAMAAAAHGRWIVLGVAVCAMLSYFLEQRRASQSGNGG